MLVFCRYSDVVQFDSYMFFSLKHFATQVSVLVVKSFLRGELVLFMWWFFAKILISILFAAAFVIVLIG